jgi:hypothetical protein
MADLSKDKPLVSSAFFHCDFSGASYEMEFAKGADIKASKGGNNLWRLLYFEIQYGSIGNN